MKRIRFLTIPLLAVLMGIALLLPLSAGAASMHATNTRTASAHTGALTQTVTNNATTYNGVPALFNGTLTITHFVKQGGQLLGLGTASGTITNLTGGLLTPVTSAPATVPIQSADPSCSILTLHTGAIHLDLLGLVVDLSPINLTITAQSGPGNLLGNLLCAVANLLNGGGPLTSITGLLNRILSLL
ncbi:MAG TPA: hypothetical protein VF043_16640 [Ktedonobacteraceae bacterium]